VNVGYVLTPPEELCQHPD